MDSLNFAIKSFNIIIGSGLLLSECYSQTNLENAFKDQFADGKSRIKKRGGG